MPNHFLHYWVPERAAHELEQGRPPFTIGSNQLTPRKVQRDDTIWIVTVEDGVLLLLGRVVVESVTEGRDAAMQRFNTTDLWEADYTVIAQSGTVESLSPINISPIAGELTFQSVDAPRLTLTDGKVNPQQLQATRLLTRDSADLLEECWETAEDSSNNADEAL